MNYITVLDFEAGRVFQYEITKTLTCDSIGEYLTNKGHNLTNCEWMAHDDSEIITP
jgi:hypothetical protein